MTFHDSLLLLLTVLRLVIAALCIGAIIAWERRMPLWRRVSLGLVGAGMLMHAFGVVLSGEPLFVPLLILLGILLHVLVSYRPARWLHVPTVDEAKPQAYQGAASANGVMPALGANHGQHELDERARTRGSTAVRH